MSCLFADTHNVVAILEKSDVAKGFEQIIDFLSGSYIHYALTVNPYIYISFIKQFWNTAYVKHSNDVTRLQGLVDRKKIVISEDVICEILQLDDAEGVVCLPNEEIFAGLAQMGYEKPSIKLTFYKTFFSSQWKFLIHTLLQSLSAKRTSWNDFSTTMASAVICLSKGQKFNFSKYIFDSLVRNVGSSLKFYMYPRFIQLIIQNQVGDLSTHTTRFISPALTQKVFANMRRVGKGFSGDETPLFEGMLAARQLAEEGIAEEQDNVTEDVANDVIPSPPSHDIPSPSQEQSSPPQQPQSSPQAPPQGAEFPTHFYQVLDTCSALTQRVKNLKHDKAAQKLEIIKLKARVKRLERANKVKSSKLRGLRKVGASKRIESSDDMEDVFNQGRMIDDLDKDEGIELVVDQVKDADIAETGGRHAAEQAEKQAEIYQLDLDHPSKVLSMQEDDSEVQEVVEVVTTAKLITDVVTAASQEQRSDNQRPKEELSSKTPAETPKLKDKGKGLLVETPKPMKKKDQIELDAEYARKLHEEINKDHEEINKDIDWMLQLIMSNKNPRILRMSYDEICPIFQASFDANMRFLFKSKEEMEEEDQEVLKSINETLAHKAAKRRKPNEQAQEAEDLKKPKRRKPNEQAQEAEDLKKRLEVVEDEDDDVFTEATPLARKGIVKERFSTSKLTNFFDEYLLTTLKTMFEKPDGQDDVWKSQRSVHGLALVKTWKLLTSCGVHIITLLTIQLILLVKRRYPLLRFTLEQLVNVTRLQVEEESDMSLELLRSTPIETNKVLLKEEEAEDVDVHLYRLMIGSLMYLTASRPDIIYLKGQPKLGIWYPKDSPFDLEAFSDSDYVGARLDRKSTTRGCQFLGKRLISWQCKKQTIGVNSTTKAEYVVAANCCGHVLWIQNHMLDYGFNFMNNKIYIDNESTICIVKNPVYHSKTRHIEIRNHFIRDSYDKRLIQVIKIHTDYNVADLLTKAFDVSSGKFGVNTARKKLILLSQGKAKHNDWIGCDDTKVLRYALTKNPTIYVSLIQQFWQTATIRTLAYGEMEITATINGKVKVVTEASVRRHLKLEDSDGISILPTTKIFDQHALMRISIRLETKVPQPSSPTHTYVADEAASIGVDVRHKGVATTVTSLNAGQCSDRVLALKADLKQTKKVYGASYTKLIMKVKKLEKIVKTSQARRKAKIVVSDEEVDLEDPSKQGRKIEEIDQDPDISLIQHDADIYRSVDISPASLTRRVSTADDITMANTLVYIKRSAAKIKDKGKGIIEEPESAMTEIKRQQEQEKLGHDAAVRLQEEFDEEEKQRIARVHEAAQSFTEEEWENIRARVEADKELTQRLQAKERNKYSEVNQAKMLVDLINQRKRYFAEQKAEAKRKKPMTQAQ
nr:putative ribonuclease H-like domain-containing protein [Tanacetum cinerariifolium]